MATCRSCNAEIIWVKTAKGKNMPIDAEELEHLNGGDRAFTIFDREGNSMRVEPGETVVGHLSHFGTCPNADKHRRG